MPEFKEHKFKSFDGGVQCRGKLFAPEDTASLSAAASALAEEPAVIARGAGLSFCAASFAQETLSIDMTRLNRIDCLESEKRLVTVQSGVPVGRLLDFLLEYGFYIPVLPGYPAITVGGCIAADVHGKNQCRDGNFVGRVESFRLHHVDHGEIDVSREKHAELFDLTIGGCGLTGTVLSATLKVEPAPSRFIDMVTEPIDDIYSLASVLKRYGNCDYLISWHDFNRSGSGFGRGYIQRGVFSQSEKLLLSDSGQTVFPLKPHDHTRFSCDSAFGRDATPSFLTSMVAVGLLNCVYDFKQRLSSGPAHKLPLGHCYFPAKTLRDLYFKAFGKHGLFEHQAVVPDENFPEYIEKVQSWLTANELPIAMASGKLFRGEQRFLRFNGSGVCFALDFPRCERAIAFLSFLDRLCSETGAVPSIFKDSRIPRMTVEACYPEYDQFKEQIFSFDPKRRYQSELSRRLGL